MTTPTNARALAAEGRTMSKRARRRTMYMHTIWGRPAFYDARTGEVYLAGGRTAATLHGSLSEIRRQQRQSEATRARKGYEIELLDYGYCLVRATP